MNDTLQQKIEITDLKPCLAADNTSVIRLLHSTVYQRQNTTATATYECSYKRIKCVFFPTTLAKYDWILIGNAQRSDLAV